MTNCSLHFGVRFTLGLYCSRMIRSEDPDRSTERAFSDLCDRYEPVHQD